MCRVWLVAFFVGCVIIFVVVTGVWERDVKGGERRGHECWQSHQTFVEIILVVGLLRPHEQELGKMHTE